MTNPDTAADIAASLRAIATSLVIISEQLDAMRRFMADAAELDRLRFELLQRQNWRDGAGRWN